MCKAKIAEKTAKIAQKKAEETSLKSQFESAVTAANNAKAAYDAYVHACACARVHTRVCACVLVAHSACSGMRDSFSSSLSVRRCMLCISIDRVKTQCVPSDTQSVTETVAPITPAPTGAHGCSTSCQIRTCLPVVRAMHMCSNLCVDLFVPAWAVLSRIACVQT